MITAGIVGPWFVWRLALAEPMRGVVPSWFDAPLDVVVQAHVQLDIIERHRAQRAAAGGG